MNCNDKKVLTIAVAAYNVEKYIESALTSLIVPEIMDRLEVMVIDDGSSDSTYEKASVYEKKYPQTFRVVHKENGGWGSTVNKGIELAKGKFFRQLDGDDQYMTESLQDYIDFLDKCDADLVISPYVVFVDDTGDIANRFEYSLANDTEAKAITDLTLEYNLSMHSAAIRTELLKKNNVLITEHCFYTDSEYMIRAFMHVRTYAYFDQVIYRYRIGREGQSMSIKSMITHKEDQMLVLKKMLSLYDEIEDGPGKDIIKRRLEIMIRTVYDLYWLRADDRKGLITYDEWLKRGWPDIYRSCASKKIKVSRSLNFISYKWMSLFVKNHYKEIC